MHILQTSTQNLLLGALSPSDFALLAPHITRIPLPIPFQLHGAGTVIDQIYFPEAGIVSIVGANSDGNQCEVGIFGREGMSGTAAVLGTNRSPHQVFVQIAGASALRLAAAAMHRAMHDSETLSALLLGYVQTTVVQSASSILAATADVIEERLARWLLMCHDRLDGNDVRLTHEFMSMMLGTRRAGVTLALHDIETKGLIRTTRGTVIICDRAGLEHLAGDSYGFAEAEYERLLGMSIQHRQPRIAANMQSPTSTDSK